MTPVQLNGVSFPHPSAVGGIVEGWETIWSDNAGYTASGQWVGTIIAVKRVVTWKWSALTPSEGQALVSVLLDAARNRNGVVTCRYFSVESNADVTFDGVIDLPSLTHLLSQEGLEYLGETSLTVKEA